MNEPKKRGRPSKAELEARAMELRQSISSPAVLEAARQLKQDIETFIVGGAGDDRADEFARRQAQAYANRMWAGQSTDLPRAVRVDRIKTALEAQGLSMEGVQL